MERTPLIETFQAKNAQINLSAIRDPEGIYAKHILDSIELNTFFPLKKHTQCIDVGTGGGFPLLPLAMTNPQCTFTGIDARKKKIAAINDMIQTLQIPNAKVTRTRAEDHKKQYDYCTARAVSYIDNLLVRSYKLVKNGGHFIFYKLYSQEEHMDIIRQCKKRKLAIRHEHHYQLPDDDVKRVIYILQKNTP